MLAQKAALLELSRTLEQKCVGSCTDTTGAFLWLMEATRLIAAAVPRVTSPFITSKPTGFTLLSRSLSLSLSLSLHQALATVPRHYINGVLEVTLIELGVSSVIIARR